MSSEIWQRKSSGAGSHIVRSLCRLAAELLIRGLSCLLFDGCVCCFCLPLCSPHLRRESLLPWFPLVCNESTVYTYSWCHLYSVWNYLNNYLSFMFLFVYFYFLKGIFVIKSHCVYCNRQYIVFVKIICRSTFYYYRRLLGRLAILVKCVISLKYCINKWINQYRRPLRSVLKIKTRC